MWPWIKRWRDWAMHNLWPLHRSGTSPQALKFRFEKAGLVGEGQAIPWNADAVLVEGWVRMPPGLQRQRGDFRLHLPGPGGDYLAEDFLLHEESDRWRLLFRLPVPAQTVTAEILQRNRLLGQITLPILTEKEFTRCLTLQLPTLFLQYKEHTVPCQVYVSTQCQGLIASALLASPTGLWPLADMGLRLELRTENGNELQEMPLPLARPQLQATQALITVALRKPRRIGSWLVQWVFGDKVLASQKLKAISRQQFLRSLQVNQARFLCVTAKNEVRLANVLPDVNDLQRAGPCFLVGSREPGMAGFCSLQVRAQVAGAVRPPLLQEQEVLLTDAPIPFAPGTMDAADLKQVDHFELRQGNTLLYTLPLTPLPTATFTPEGGFQTPPDDLPWTAAAEDQLKERLSRLLGG